ncbi:MAG: hypothetical protein AAFW84_35135 [Cyanobacteria bacterium J06635_15]
MVFIDLVKYSGSHKVLCTTAGQISCVLSIPAVLGALSNLASAIFVQSRPETDALIPKGGDLRSLDQHPR